LNAAKILLQKQIWLARNGLVLLRGQSRLKVYFILLFAAGLEGFLWVVFYDGFRILDKVGGIGVLLSQRLFSLFFLGIMAMLVLSGMVSAFAATFRSSEIPFLLSSPFETRTIVGYKFLESSAISSWAFIAFLLPFVGAYAVYSKTSPFLLLWAGVFSVPFLLLCSAVASALLYPLLRWIPRGKAVALMGGLAPLVLCAWVLLWPGVSADGDLTQFNIRQLLPGLRVASNPLLPSWWVAEGMLSMGRGETLRGMLLLALLTTSAAVVYFALETVGVRLFYSTWQRVSEGSTRRKQASVMLGWLDRAMRRLPADSRGIILKDIRIFFRDPVQWSQGVVFFGLLGLYFSNLRSLSYNELPEHWKHAIAFLNVFSVCAVMSSLGARFVYPQLSIEGHGYWVLGLSPTTPKRIVLSKFALPGIVLASITMVLVALSGMMLDTPAATRIVSVALVGCVALGICGISTGLGAIFMDLRQSNPAAIVSGFGGTLNLVISLTFMMAAITPFALLFHLRATGRLPESGFAAGLAIALAWLGVSTFATVVAPVALGVRSLARRDF
jgi:ABC-2 type transport system permease protein